MILITYCRVCDCFIHVIRIFALFPLISFLLFFANDLHLSWTTTDITWHPTRLTSAFRSILWLPDHGSDLAVSYYIKFTNSSIFSIVNFIWRWYCQSLVIGLLKCFKSICFLVWNLYKLISSYSLNLLNLFCSRLDIPVQTQYITLAIINVFVVIIHTKRGSYICITILQPRFISSVFLVEKFHITIKLVFVKDHKVVPVLHYLVIVRLYLLEHIVCIWC